MKAIQYCPGLDGLRGIAILLVVAFHAGRLIPGGFVGVDLFFVLSAFLIVNLLVAEYEKSGSVDFRHFYARRARRLFPALGLMLVCYVAVAPVVWHGQPHLRDALLAATYLSDYTVAWYKIPRYLQHCWSLAVEEQFYFIVPLALPLMVRSRRPAMLCLVLYLMAWAWRLSLPVSEAYYRGDAHCGGLLLGAALAFARPNVPKWLGAVGSVLFVSATWGGFLESNVPGFVAEIGAAMMIGAVYQHAIAVPGVALGRLSYAVYLWHYPISVVAREALPPLAAFAVTLVVSLGFALLSRPVERRFLRRPIERSGENFAETAEIKL